MTVSGTYTRMTAEEVQGAKEVGRLSNPVRKSATNPCSKNF